MKRSLIALTLAALAASASGAFAAEAPAPADKSAPHGAPGKPGPGLHGGPGAPGGPGGATAPSAPRPAPPAWKDVSRAEAVKRATDHFDKMDLDKNGVVTFAEMEQSQREMREKFMSERDARAAAAGTPGAPSGMKKDVKPAPVGTVAPAVKAASEPAKALSGK